MSLDLEKEWYERCQTSAGVCAICSRCGGSSASFCECAKKQQQNLGQELRMMAQNANPSPEKEAKDFLLKIIDSLKKRAAEGLERSSGYTVVDSRIENKNAAFRFEFRNPANVVLDAIEQEARNNGLMMNGPYTYNHTFFFEW